ncbi:MAG: response regulator transcription factor [Alphaproteobacteria bacterium]|nr:response regulator transcription factor [Alphaproteobacteria bacterium]
MMTEPLIDQKPLLLVVDDDTKLRNLLVKFLSDNGFRVLAAANAAEARSNIACHRFDGIILDVMMPGETGTELIQSLRLTCAMPILFLTARDQLEDKVTGLNLGADDYITKPFEPQELLARIRAIIRRFAPAPSVSMERLRLNDYAFCVQTGRLTKDDDLVYLTSTEQILLRTLAQSPNQPFSREDLAQRIGHKVSDRTVDVQITRLRKKIGDDPRQPQTIQTIRHIGYTLCPN